MHLLFVGAGGVGGYFGGLLAARGGRVTFVARGAHGAAIRDGGLVVRTDGGRGPDLRSRPAVVLPGETPPPADAVVLCVKHRDLASALSAAAPAVGDGTPVLSLLNGIGHEAEIRRALPAARPMIGAAFVGASIERPGVVLQTSEGRIAFGEVGPDGAPAPPSGAARALAEALGAGGFPVRLADDVRLVAWRKLLWNAAFNTANALTGRPCRDLVSVPAVVAHLRAVMLEVRAIAAAVGVALPHEWVEKSLSADVNRSEYHTSMRLDLESGRPLEIEPILSRPLRLAEDAGVAAPRLRALEALLLALQPPA